ncbi:hypothetical protein CCAX7_53190 [Capsulimonas corticalis]|uniref:Uncharacterized protein n=1 Tax=Capsulimonas corticalis TaxID=2219043 RepID=A0A402CNX8_9BACT|nr:hypothetical protein [Capsulimonas corticalis]BDI33268.1 hypothetical protein CCAX7_53190 [Capsulimonas corticalis]
MTLGLPSLDWRRMRAAAFACACVALLARSADAASPNMDAAVSLCAMSDSGASATAPAGWTLTANASGENIHLRSADGLAGAEWGLASLVDPVHDDRGDGDTDADVEAKTLLARSLRALGDSAAPMTEAARSYSSYVTGCPFETPTHRGVVFYHQYQWDENQSVVSYYIAWTDKDRWSASGFVAANVALSIRASLRPCPHNPFWAEGKQEEAEEGLQLAREAYNHNTHVVCLLSKTPDHAYMLTIDNKRKPLCQKSGGPQIAMSSE